MIRIYKTLLVALLLFAVSAQTLIADQHYETYTREEMRAREKGTEYLIGMNHEVTEPPVGDLRNSAEWERSTGVIIRYPLGIPVSLVAAYSENVTVWTICTSSYVSSATSYYQSHGVNMDNVEFIVASTNTHWTRDYGPWFIFRDKTLEIVDTEYNRPRPLDDLIPQVIGSLWNMAVYGMDLEHTGGNHMSNGLGMSMSTELVYNENPGKTPREIEDLMHSYLGNYYTVLEYIESGGIHHIDCWAKMLSPNTILVKDVPSGDASYQLLNARAEWLSNQMSPWGDNYNIVRVYCPYGTAYTNSIILNDVVYVPTFNSSWDDDAIQTYEDAMPGYTVLGFDGSWYDDDAIHCRAMGVPDSQMLWIEHVPLHETTDTENDRLVSAKIEACSGAALIMDSCKIYYSVNDGAFVSAPLYSTADPDSFYGHIPAQGPGAEVKYFIRAADLSGRVENHPFIGEPWAHAYSVTAANEPPVLAEIGPQEVDEGSNLSFTVYASDPDLTIPSIDAENLPDNATLDDNGDGTAAFDFTPDNTQAGIYSVLFIASDGSLADSEWVPITVNDINLPCYIIDPDTVLCRTEEYFSFYPEIVDPDDTTHDVTYSGYPPWLSESYDSIVGTPSIAENVSFTVEVSDGVNTDDAQVNLVIYMCGDCDSSGGVDIDDAVAIITYIFQSGSAPDPAETGDVDCSGGIDIDDAVYIITYIFSGGPPPCESCP